MMLEEDDRTTLDMILIGAAARTDRIAALPQPLVLGRKFVRGATRSIRRDCQF